MVPQLPSFVESLLLLLWYSVKLDLYLSLLIGDVDFVKYVLRDCFFRYGEADILEVAHGALVEVVDGEVQVEE